jgi:hypothetical protein
LDEQEEFVLLYSDQADGTHDGNRQAVVA